MIRPDIVTAYKDHAGGLHASQRDALWENWKESQRRLRVAANAITGGPHVPDDADALFNAVIDAAHTARETWAAYIRARTE